MSTPSPSWSPPWTAPAAPRPSRTADHVVTIVTLVLMVLTVPLLMFAGAFMSMGTDSCSATHYCDDAAINQGIITAFVGPAVVGLLGLVAAIVQMVRGKLAWPWAVGSFALAAVVWVLGILRAAKGM